MQSHFFPNDILNDRELIKTIQVFLKNNMNMSQTAKELHLHRNSLQYRLDKFSTQTGIDVRVFYQSALTALLLAKKNNFLDIVHKVIFCFFVHNEHSFFRCKGLQFRQLIKRGYRNVIDST